MNPAETIADATLAAAHRLREALALVGAAVADLRTAGASTARFVALGCGELAEDRERLWRVQLDAEAAGRELAEAVRLLAPLEARAEEAKREAELVG